ncbi:phosphoglucosamine mutase [bacterium]|nr:phosphoglucosamine mutase [bacterium]
MLKESISGVRGIVGRGLNPEILLNYCSAFAEILEPGKIVVGRDSRTSGDAISRLVCGTLQLAGREVVDIGIQATPTVEVYVDEIDAAGGIIITASHNPSEWNALKFLGKGGLFLDSLAFTDLQSHIKKQPAWVKFDSIGEIVEGKHPVEKHIDRVLGLPYIDIQSIRKRRFKVVVDANGGTGAIALLPLLVKLNCNIIELNCKPDGFFRHGAEPIPENLTALEKAVISNSADIGFATDPDADRLALVDDLGHAIGEEYTLALGVAEVLHFKPGPVVINLSTSAMVESLDQPVIRMPVGEINVAKKMLEIDSPCGGEGNGGLIVPECHPGRDAILAAAVILNHLARQDKALSEAIACFPKLFMLKTKTPFDGQFDNSVSGKLKSKLNPQGIDLSDGIRFSWHDKWVHVRASNTEPILRIIAEAGEISESEKLISAVKSALA